MKVLFLCTGNSCRSQMAEGWARQLKRGVIEPYSAGIEKHGLNPHAVKVMGEAGVDISRQFSKTLDDLKDVTFDCVVTVCGHALEHCPIFPGSTKVVHAGFEDPPALTKHLPDGEEKLAVYRRVREEIRRFVETLPAALTMIDQPATAAAIPAAEPRRLACFERYLTLWVLICMGVGVGVAFGKLLVEVPVMPSVCRLCNESRPWYQRELAGVS